VDLSGLTVGNTVHVKDLLLPKGVEVVLRGKENPAVVICQVPRASADDESTAAPSAADVPAAKQKAPDAAAKDAPAKK
jgi:large subunit ribosomal protein L25